MGRPLNKKYFGNRNIGTTGTGDNKIGGEGIASINWSNYGSWLSATSGSAPLAGLALPAPTLPGGVQATWTNYFGASQVTTGAGSVGLVVGETYEYAPIPGLVVTVATSGNDGTNATFTVTAAGSTTTLLQDLTGVNLTRLTGSGAATFLVDIRLKIVNTVINEKGSGYTGAETFTVTTVNGASGTVPAGTIVLTTSGQANASQNLTTTQENAIVMYANVTGAGTNAYPVDIIKQVSATRYKVTDGTYTGIIELTRDTTPDTGYGYIKAVDSAGGTYYIIKLTARLAVVRQGTGTMFENYERVKWTFGSPVEKTATERGSVQIENA